VSKGLVANKQELENAFPDMSRNDIIKNILTTGELQKAELERDTASESLIKDIANIVAEKTLNSKSFTRFPVTVILKAINAVHYAAKPGESAKKQALALIKTLEKVLPLRRIRMRLGLHFPIEAEEKYFFSLIISAESKPC